MNEEVHAVTREQANHLIWAETKPILWAGAAIACVGLGVFFGGWALLPAIAGTLFCGFKTWQAEREHTIVAQRVQANVDSNEFAKEFAHAWEKSKTTGIEPTYFIENKDLAHNVAMHLQSASPAAQESPAKQWSQGFTPKTSTATQPKTLMDYAALSPSAESPAR